MSSELLLGMAVGLTSSLLMLRITARVVRWGTETETSTYTQTETEKYR